jgi:hypothetical protein
MKLEYVLVTSLGAALTLVACFPDITYRETDTGGGGSGNGSGSGGHTGGSSGSAGSGGVTTSSGGGGGAAPCVLGELGACGGGSKCSVVDTGSGAVGCVAAGDRAAWTRCFSDADCIEGTWCDAFTQVCHPICSGSGDCVGQDAECVPAKAGATAIPGLKMCTADCHPLNGQPCSDEHGPTSCYYSVENVYWDCIRTQGFQSGTDCNTYTECARGLVCVDQDGCTPWCINVGGLCNVVGVCVPVNPTVTYHGTEMGICI